LLQYQLAIVGKGPGACPELALKRRGILQIDGTDVCRADMAQGNFAVAWIGSHKLGNWRGGTGLVVFKLTQTTRFIKTDAKAIAMRADFTPDEAARLS
jgi:hypothetical protein